MFGRPMEAIDFQKIKKIKNTAYFYSSYTKIHNSFDFRFDVIEIVLLPEALRIINGKDFLNSVCEDYRNMENFTADACFVNKCHQWNLANS